MTKQDRRQGGQGPAVAARNKRLIKFLSQPLILEESGPPKVVSHLMIAASFLVIGFIAWAAITQIEETALASGQVMPAGSVHVVQHLEGGIVSEILVKEGDVVTAGQPLFRMQQASAMAELDQFRAREASLALQAERLRAFVLGHQPDFSAGGEHPNMTKDQQAILDMQLEARESQQAVLLSQIEQRKAEIASLANQRGNLVKQTEILGEQLEMRRTLLEKGLVSRIRFLESEQALNEAMRELSALDGNALRAREALIEAQSKLAETEASLGNDALKEMGEVSAELAQVREHLIKLRDRVQRLEIAAPVDGVVKGLEVNTVGSVVLPGDVLTEIVPFDGEMVAEVEIEPRHVGHLQIGQDARVKVTTFDVAKFGAIPGELTHISASTFEDEQGQPHYRATITLDRPYAGSNSAQNRILPGMLVDADIQTGRKSLLRYLLKPVYRSLDVAFSER